MNYKGLYRLSRFTSLLCLFIPLLNICVDAKPIVGEFNEGFKAWSFSQGDSNAKVVKDVINSTEGKAARIRVSKSTPTSLTLKRKFSLPTDKGLVCRVRGRIRPQDFSGAVKLIAIFQGGSSVGNGIWHVKDFTKTAGSWSDVQIVKTVPVDSKAVELRILADKGCGELYFDKVTIEILTPDQLELSAKVYPDSKKVLSQITPLHFSAVTAFWFPGIYYGTLPASDPESRRAEFIDALDSTGIKALRFPGGMHCHRYLAEGPEYSKMLAAIKKNGKGAGTSKQFLKKGVQWEGDGADSGDWPRNNYPRWQDFRDTCKEAGVKIIYQLNTCFYVDDKGEIKPTVDNKFSLKAGFAEDAHNAKEAAAALERLFKKGVFKAGDVDYWEIGNEEFALMEAVDFADIVSAYAKVIAKYDPNRPICYNGMGWRDSDMPKMLSDRGVFKYMTGTTTHYPYSQWPTPSPAINTAGYEDFSQAYVNFKKSTSAWAGRDIAKKLKLSVSETNVYKFHIYDSQRMNCSFAHSLALARNWPELISSPVVDMAVYHELETTFFGMMYFHVSFDQASRQYSWLEKDHKWKSKRNKKPSRNGGPKPTLTFVREFTLSPSAHVMKLLSSFVGTRVLDYKIESENGNPGFLIGTDGKRQLLFVSNAEDKPLRISVQWPKDWKKTVAGKRWIINSNSVYAALEDEYSQRVTDAPAIKGDGLLDIAMPAYSVQLFEWK